MPTETDDREARLDAIIAEYLKAIKNGSAPPRSQLLEAHPDLADQISSFFADQDQFERLTKPLRAVFPPNSSLPAGEAVGDYDLIEEIARGGMGVVYRARHRTLQRVVALKMLRAGSMADAAQLQRFRTEAEAVAHLDHPNIVPIYDVGEHQGQPYYCMKLVEGGSLAEHSSRLQAEPLAAAALLADVAAAVHYAHQRGVLHRDLKPANILLSFSRDPEGSAGPALPSGSRLNEAVALVTDFGLAKRVEVDSNLTQSGALVGTPSYMAPEQAAGKRGALTTAADVYGLGAVLYECLTGRPPFRGETVMDTLRLVLESEVFPPRAINPRVNADLETICLKCLEKEPRQRYASARDLADDLQHYLAGEPIQARPVSSVGRVVRFCRRQPLLAMLWLALCVGLGLTSWQWMRAEYHRAEAERQEGEKEKQRADAEKLRQEAVQNLREKESLVEDLKKQKIHADSQTELADERFKDAHQAVSRFYKQFSERPELDSVPGLQPLRKELMTEAREYYQRFLKQRGDDPAIKAELADIHLRVGYLIRETDAPAKALDSYRKALALYQELAAAEPKELSHRAGMARAHADLANLYSSLGQMADDLRELESARALREELVAADPKSFAYRTALARDYTNLGVYHDRVGHKAEALVWFEKVRDLRSRLLAEYPRNVSLASNLAMDWSNLSVIYDNQGKADASREALEKAQEIRERLAKQTPQTPELQTDLASVYRGLARWYRLHGKASEGLTWCDKALALIGPVAEANPQVTHFQEELASLYKETAQGLRFTGKRTEGLEMINKARQIQEKLAPLFPPGSPFQQSLGHTYFELGFMSAETGQRAEAILAYQQCRDVRLKLVKAHPDRADYQSELGMTLHNLATQYGPRGRMEEALAALVEALPHTRIAYQKSPDEYRGLLNAHYFVYAEYLRTTGRVADALEAQQERIKLWKDNPKEFFRITRELALCADAVGKGKLELSAEEMKLKTRCADLAVEVLKMAIAAGYNDAEKLEKDTAFDPLRPRDDFKELLATIAKKKEE